MLYPGFKQKKLKMFVTTASGPGVEADAKNPIWHKL